MSHVSSYKTEIRLESALGQGRSVEEDPGWEILDEAVRATAEELGLELVYAIRDYYGRSILCDWALAGPAFPRGVGVKVDRTTGEVMFLADTYGGFERAASQIKDRVVQNYTAMCVARALKELNYAVEVQEEEHPVEGKRVLVRGVL